MTHAHGSSQDSLILVNEDDSIIGYADKLICHQGQGLLHRAFSIFLFNDRQELLIQKRSREKLLWPLYWSNSVCSHPRPGESYETATIRRLHEELGLTAPLHFLFRFQYQAAFKDVGAEHELCSVYIGKIQNQKIAANSREIAEWKYIDAQELQQGITRYPDHYTPWFKIEWARMQEQYASHIQAVLS